MKRGLPILVVALFLAGIFIVPVGVSITPARLQETNMLNDVTLEQDAELSWLPADKNVRIAVYNTTNSTKPSYVYGTMRLNNSWIMNILSSAGYSVTELNLQDIQNHELQTKNYDVLVLADLVPNENITNLVKEFWLSGGGVLATDTAGEFLNFAGILPREAVGTNGRTVYWDYIIEGNFNVTTRHPVTKSYQVGEALYHSSSDFFMWDLSALSGTSLNGEFTVLVEDYDDSNNVKAIAVDPSDMGGRTVHLGIPTSTYAPTGWDAMLVDAVEWLCPRPKGRILYDLTHHPYYGVDSWEAPIVNFENNYYTFRDTLVNKSYTFDKLWPSTTGNLTAGNLAEYDMLVIVMPGLNFSSSEVQAVTNWVYAGGSLLVLGDQFGYSDQRSHVNYLLGSYGLRWNSTHNEQGASNIFATHPVCESLSLVFPAAGGVVDVSGPAFQLVKTNNNDIVAGGQEYGTGRVVMVSDINIFAYNYIDNDDDNKFAVNIANWLTASKANVLVYTDGGDVLIDPNYNFYKSPVANALNALQLKFLMTNTVESFNVSLNTDDLDLVILDQNYYGFTTSYYLEVKSYVEAGGRLISRSWSSAFESSLGTYLGFKSNLTSISSGPPTVYLWNPAHEIFNIPNDYGADNITTSNNDFNTDYRHYEPLANGTALAGITQSPSGNNSAIIMSTVVPAITNSFSISQYFDDTDDSTYGDGYEIFMNEIAYLMRPQIDSPTDIVMEIGSVGVTLTWTPQSDRPYSYIIMRNLGEIANTAWDGGPISILLDGYLLGVYLFEITVYDTAGYSATDIVTVTVEDTTGPAFVDGPDNLFYQQGTTTHLLNWSFTELLPDYWVLYINGSVHDSGSWDGSEISADAGGLTEGTYNATIAVNDTSNNVATSTVTLVVGPPPTTTTTPTGTTSTTPTDTGTTTPPPGDNTLLIIIIAAVAGVVVIIIIIVLMKKKS